jgi:hypothetical protein
MLAAKRRKNQVLILLSVVLRSRCNPLNLLAAGVEESLTDAVRPGVGWTCVEARHGGEATEHDVDGCIASSCLQLEVIDDFVGLVPGLLDCVGVLRSKGVAIGATSARRRSAFIARRPTRRTGPTTASVRRKCPRGAGILGTSHAYFAAKRGVRAFGRPSRPGVSMPRDVV